MKIGLVQMSSVLDYRENLNKLENHFQKAEAEKVEAVFLPECYYSISDGLKATPHLVEGENVHYQNIRQLAKKHKVALLGGSVATKVGDKIVNRIFNFDKSGDLLGIYDKIHLFSCQLGPEVANEKKIYDETKVYQSGNKLSTIKFNNWRMGMSICFDLRFPELFRLYSLGGIDLMSVSSAFTVPTGKAHWYSLLRARAIENQCYIVASAQWGKHNERMESFGHSLVIDPWGEILVDLGEGEKFASIDLNIEKVIQVRKRMDLTPRLINAKSQIE